MMNLVKSEYRKFLSTKMWWILLLAMIGYMAMMGASVALIFTMGDSAAGTDMNGNPIELDSTQIPQSVYTIASTMGYIFPALIGAMSFTGEFRHKTITPTLIATPNRSKVLCAKLLSGLPMGAIFGAVGTLSTVGAAALVLVIGDVPTQLGTLFAWEIIGRSVLSLTLWLLLGVALGSAIKNQAVVVVGLIAFTQLVEPLARIAAPVFESVAGIVKFLPGAVGDAIAGGSFYGVMGSSQSLSLLGGIVVMVVYIAAFAALGRVTSLARDIN